MRRKFLTIFAVTIISVTAAATQVNAQVSAEIPFDFVVGEESFPAGEYVVEKSGNGVSLSVRSLEVKEKVVTSPSAGRVVVELEGELREMDPGTYVEVVAKADTSHRGNFMSRAVEDREKTGKYELVFNRYGKTHFLSQVWTGSTRGRELPKSRAERDLARQFGK